jgi:hypothetical protein
LDQFQTKSKGEDTMKSLIIEILIVTMVVSAASAITTEDGTKLTGAHYNLNIIGVQNRKTADMTGTSGHTIFVDLEGKSKISLAEAPEGESFEVLDRNGTGGSGAKFQLPAADPDNTGTTWYSVFARPLGQPNGKAKMTTGATDPGPDGVLGTADDITVYSVSVLAVERTKGHQKFENVTEELLYIYTYVWVDAGPDGIAGTADDTYAFERVPLFDDTLQDYFWDYDNNGLKLLQLRFYEGVETTVRDIVSITPTSGVQGTNDLLLTITGDGIALGTGATVAFDCAGISIDSVVKVDNNTLNVTIDIASDAAIGTCPVTVTRIDDGVEWLGGFNIVAP